MSRNVLGSARKKSKLGLEEERGRDEAGYSSLISQHFKRGADILPRVGPAALRHSLHHLT